MDENAHLETIKRVKQFINEKDHEGLKNYIYMRENEVEEYDYEDKSSKYMEELISKLN